MNRLKLFMALPTYDGSRFNMQPILNAFTHPGPFGIRVAERIGALLTRNCNHLWVEALNARAEGATHFLLLHADVSPVSPTWLAELYAIMERTNASVLSVAMPIKDHRGLTSTALEADVRGAKPHPRRLLAVRELERDFPSTFTLPNLLVNTGLLLVDLREPWVELVCFCIRDGIGQDASGRWVSVTEPEDWFFSRQARAHGARVWVTRGVAAVHRGGYEFPNYGDWHAPPVVEEEADEHQAAMQALYDEARVAAREIMPAHMQAVPIGLEAP